MAARVGCVPKRRPSRIASLPMDRAPRPASGTGSASGPTTSTGGTAGSADYPEDAVRWLVGSTEARVLELRCGSGELTAALSGLGHDVIATDPSAQLVARLGHTVPNARLAVARPEDLPFPASSVDIVAAASGDVDAERALPEVARVLRPGGILAVIRSSGDPKVPWVRKVLALVGVGSTPAPDNPFESSDLFTLTERRSFRRWQQFFRPTLVAFVADSPKATMLSQADRADLLDEAGALYDSYGRGPDGLLMPWVVDCYRARVQGKTGVVTADVTDDGLLIDFF